jgi:hypothetical protein
MQFRLQLRGVLLLAQRLQNDARKGIAASVADDETNKKLRNRGRRRQDGGSCSAA